MPDTKMPKISIIAAIGNNSRAVGKDNKLLWHMPHDLKRFKKITDGHPVIMGGKTFESIGRVLPNRLNIVITRDKNFSTEGAKVCFSPEQALALAKEHDKHEIFIIGGGEIWKQMLPSADRLYLTLVDENENTEADTFFPDYSDFKKIISKERDEEHSPASTFVILER